MNILFLTLYNICSIHEQGIYQDLMRQFVKAGHQVYVASPSERRTGQPTRIIEEDCKILKVKIGNVQKTNIIEKGISTVLMESQFKTAIAKYLSDVKFDLVLYSTPPITFANVVKYIKKRDGAKSYLLLKDIFPQNAVDMGMMHPTGLKSPLYWFFRRKEERLYAISDYIGCMSEANVQYVVEHNPKVDPAIVEACPNTIEVLDLSLDAEEKSRMRQKYGMPEDKKIFVYGGNLGRPQGIPFLIECLKSQQKNPDAFFLIVGDGTEYGALQRYVTEAEPENVKLMKRLPQEDYDRMIAACDVGMIFLDHRFTIPNFPSRLLSYMQVGIPILACTDPNTDIGKVITDNGFGWWCQSNDVPAFGKLIDAALSADLQELGAVSREYLETHYHVERSYSKIMSHMDG